LAFPNKGRVPRTENKDKPFRDALRAAMFADNHKKLRQLAEKLFERAMEGEVPAIREIADRLDGKPPQAVVGDDAGAPLQVIIRRFTDVDVPSK